MIQLVKWTERKFEFEFSASVYPAIVSRLAGTPARLEEIANSLTREELTKKVNDSWSVQEHIGHLFDLEELHSKRLQEYLNKADVLPAADMTNKKTYEANHNSKNISDILKKFRKARTEYVEVLDKLDEDIIIHYAYHPRLKIPMRLVDNAFFAAEHDDHHIAIMRRIIASFKN
jgi:hypothetical protein